MSYTREVTIWCDGVMKDKHQCPTWEQESGRVSDLRKLLHKRRWTHVGRKDFCPRCSLGMKTKKSK